MATISEVAQKRQKNTKKTITRADYIRSERFVTEKDVVLNNKKIIIVLQCFGDLSNLL